MGPETPQSPLEVHLRGPGQRRESATPDQEFAEKPVRGWIRIRNGPGKPSQSRASVPGLRCHCGRGRFFQQTPETRGRSNFSATQDCADECARTISNGPCGGPGQAEGWRPWLRPAPRAGPRATYRSLEQRRNDVRPREPAQWSPEAPQKTQPCEATFRRPRPCPEPAGCGGLAVAWECAASRRHRSAWPSPRCDPEPGTGPGAVLQAIG